MFYIIQLPQFKFSSAKIVSGKKIYLLVAGGRKPDLTWLKQAAEDKVVVCADKGVSYCKQAGIVPKYLLGDGDSALADFDWAEQNGVQVKKYDAYKDKTDLQLALELIEKQLDVGMLLVTGIWGGRFDHAYSALFSVLAFSREMAVPTLLLDNVEAMFLSYANDKLTINFAETPEVVSVLPLDSRVKVILSGCEWPLDNSIIEQDHPYAISNRLKFGATKLDFALHEGVCGLYFCFSF